jgi:spore germination protein GerM
MPINGMQLPSVLNKEIGINKYHDMSYDYQGSDNVVVLYEKVIGDNTYYVPVTRKVNKEDSDLKTLMNAFNNKIAIMSGLTQIESLKNITGNSYSDNEVSVNLSRDSLIEDNLIDASLYEVLMVAFFYNDLDSKVSFYVDEDIVQVNGYINNEEMVSSIIFNTIKV